MWTISPAGEHFIVSNLYVQRKVCLLGVGCRAAPPGATPAVQSALLEGVVAVITQEGLEVSTNP